MIPMLDLTRQYASIRDEIDAAIRGVLEGGHFIDGANVKAFESELAEYCNVAHAVGLNSGTDALYLALRALGIGRGDEVITSPFTFIATAEAITLCGAAPVFADVDPETLNISPQAIRAAITPRTKAIIPVHLYGLAADMDAIKQIAGTHQLAILSDCAQAIGTWCNGKRLGSISNVAAFSFFPSKNLGAYGDAGAIVTNDKALAERVRRLRAHGAVRKYHHLEVGVNSRLDEIQAAILRVKLQHLDTWIRQRQSAAREYRAHLEEVENVRLPHDSPDHTYHQFTVRVPERDLVAQELARSDIQTAVHYPAPVHQQPAYANMKAGPFPHAERAAREVLSLPMFPELEKGQIAAVSLALAEACRTVRAPTPKYAPA
jgi:dTDP-4-amino-4,6-dideoxygalactose transaminase